MHSPRCCPTHLQGPLCELLHEVGLQLLQQAVGKLALAVDAEGDGQRLLEGQNELIPLLKKCTW
jgi:hypothetical protein